MYEEYVNKAKMKEEALSKNLPPKMSGGSRSGASTPSKSVNDEILSSLLRINNFDSISSLKDESLDIDLSACVTISADSAMMMTGNSLSTTDFWRVLDESAQNSQLELTLSSDGESANMRHEALLSATELPPHNLLANSSTPEPKSHRITNDANVELELAIKKETPMTTNTFSGTFLRPDPPPPGGSSNTFSPLKKIVKNLQQQQQQNLQKNNNKPVTKKQPRKQSQQSKSNCNINFDSEPQYSSKKAKGMHFIKEEPPEQLLMDTLDNSSASSRINNDNNIENNNNNNNNNNNSYSNNNNKCVIKINTSPTKFKMFLPTTTTIITNATTTTNTTYTTHENKESTTSPMNNNNSKQQKQELEMSSKEITTKATADSGSVEVGADSRSLDEIYKCIDCNGLVLKGQIERSTHELIGHRVVFKCNFCTKDFEQESSLKKHMKTHRAVETRKDSWKKCPDCGKCLKLGSMWMHRKIHSENKKYGCDICGLKFVQKINLTHHARVHTAEKPYECPECQKRFQERSHLYRHQKYHAQTRSYRCEKCGKMYKTERCLKVHNLVHLEQRPFACTVCEKSFISNSKLKQHSNIHTGERPFKCNYCPRDFTNFPNWLKHTRRRHKVDHKTGEQLENIPSYCSKKSTKPAQLKKTTTATTSATSTNANGRTSAQQQQQNISDSITTVVNNINNNNNDMTAVSTITTSSTTTVATANATVMINSSKPVVSNKTPAVATLEKAPNKRKKKPNNVPVNAQENPNRISCNNNTNNIIEAVIKKSIEIESCSANVVPSTLHNQQLNVTTNPSSSVVNNLTKPAKMKRERKQAAPKQVQKTLNIPQTSTTSLTTATTTLPLTTTTAAHGQVFALPTTISVASTMSPSLIKREIVEATNGNLNGMHGGLGVGKSNNNMMNPFTDLHCLSITSAEELIMEQALEMEESGLFDARRPSTMSAGMAETDNAVSATEASAALHFNVKHEVESEEEFVSVVNDNCNSHMLSSSLESSPYSSPASTELCSMAQPKNSIGGEICTPTSNQLSSGNSPSIYLMPANFQLHHPNITININNNNNNNNNSNSNNNNKILQDTRDSLVAQQQNQQIMNFPTQALINQLYMPTLNGNSMLLPLANNQSLPSVDTLLFSAAVAAAAASRASPTSTATTPASTTISSSRSTPTTATSTRYYRGKGVTPNNQT